MSEGCRICTGESTELQPLFHPCKCKGSIKYVHQECLMEWLNRSNKSVQQCDICHTPYKFKTIYDPSMPETIPFKFIWEKVWSNVSKNFIRSVSIMLYIFLILEVPIFWKFMGRIYTWTIDGKLPAVNNNFIDALFFGENLVSKEFTNSMITFAKIRKLFEVSYFSGLRYIFIYIVIHIALFIEREWVIRDEGFHKLLIKRVGAEPRTKLIDVFQNVINDMEDDDERMDVFLRAVNDMRRGENGELLNVEAVEENHWFDNLDEENVGNRDAIVAEAVEAVEADEQATRPIEHHFGTEFDSDGSDYEPNGDSDSESELSLWDREPDLEPSSFAEEDGDLPFYNEDPNERRIEQLLREIEIHERLEGPEANELRRMELRARQAHQQRVEEEKLASQEREQEEREREERERQERERLERERQERERLLRERLERDRQERQERERHERQERERQEREVARQVARQAEAEEAEDRDENMLEMFGFKLNISIPVFLLAICNTVVGTYLFFTYLIPEFIGYGLIFYLHLLFQLVAVFLPKVKIDLQPTYQYLVSKLNPSMATFVDYIVMNVVILLKSLNNLFTNEKTPSTMERALTLIIGYSTVGLVVYQFMKSLARSAPVTGTPRKIYKVLFEIAITLKVFVIFAIEIFFFPVYCGWLIDFCVAPLLLESFKCKTDDEYCFHVLFTSTIPFLTIDYIRISIYWACGTLYMLFFALFIGMVRSKILRPGVLFFIRSPDDPNARLIHDALVKPMMLQLSRIYLSGKVYSAFIIVGIGGITWGLRFFIQENDENVLLPIKLYSFNHIIFILATIGAVVNNKQFLNKLSERYWKTAFELSCHKLRLSHFILGRPIAQERGYVSYSSIYHWFFQTPPDYSHPVTYKESVQLGDKEPSYFIPNGDYIRVPDNDTVSRRFIKKLFVAVTKDDKLLKPLEPVETVDEGDESDDEISENTYSIVYKPPYLKFRCFMLIVLLWVWSILLILSVIMTALIIGKPIIKGLTLVSALNENLFKLSVEQLNNSLNNYDWRVADFGSIAFGMFCELYILKWFFKDQAQEFVNNNVINFRVGFINYSKTQIFITLMLMTFSIILNLFWMVTVHKFGIDTPLSIWKNPETFELNNEINLDLKVVLLHLVISYWTLIPFGRRFFMLNFPVNYDLSTIVKILDIYKLSKDLLLIQVPFFTFVGTKIYLGSFSTNDLLVFPGLLGLYLMWNLFQYGRTVFIKFNDEVKNEKYVTGVALENVF